ncbi:MAG: POTRA domain-containing protein [Vicinamibacterales bacterium]
MRGLLAAVFALAAALPAAASGADVSSLLGRRVTDVKLDVDGAPVGDRSVVDLVETRVGEPLDMADVRQTIDHFVTLGRYEDIKVYAEPDGDGVRLRYGLVPVEQVTSMSFEGLTGLDERDLRLDLADEFGAMPGAARLPEMVRMIVARYRDHGYAQARVEVGTVPDGSAGHVAAHFVATPGRPTLVRHVTVDGPPAATRGVLERLGLAPGRPIGGTTLDDRVAAYEDELKARGYYEAVVSASVTPVEDGGADVAVRVSPGDPVDLVFTGDPVPEDRRRTLVPIERLRSVEEEVLEDASRNIEQYFRLEGYRAASATVTRSQVNGRLRIAFAVDRGPLYVLNRVEVDGVRALPRTELDPLLKLQTGEAFVDARVGAVAAALTEHYRVRGFASVKVSTTVAFPEGPAQRTRVPVNVRFEVAEGPRSTVAAVRVEGARALAPSQLLEGLGLTAGKPYYRPQHVLDRETIERRYRNLGYQRASVEARTESVDPERVTLVYVVREGPQTVVDHVLVSGASRTSPELVRREITLKPGSPLGYEALIESQQRLSALGLFRRVRITEAPHGADDLRRDVLVELEEAPSTGVSYGGGIEVGPFARTSAAGTATDRIGIAPRGFFEITRRNLFGKNRSVSLLTSVSLRPTDPGIDAGPDARGGYGLNQYRVIGTFREPRAFGTVGDAQVSAFTERGIRSSFNFDRRGVRGEYARRVGSDLRLLGRYSYDFTTLFDTKIAAADQPLVDRLFPQVRLSTLFGSALRDSRNDVLDPERGTVLGTDLEVAPRQLGSEVGFVKAFAQAFVYRRLPGGRPFVVAAGARLGLAHGFERAIPRIDASGTPVLDADGQPVVDVVTDLPASARFYAGGDSTVRGFALDRLGTLATLNPAGFPTGGNGLVVMNVELRTPYLKGVGLVGFVDSGNVFRRASDIDVADLRSAAGFGFRYRSPLGPLRLDVGFKLDRRDLSGGTERRVVFHLSLGQAF